MNNGKFYVIAGVLVVFIIGGLAYRRYDLNRTNRIWQTQLKPGVERLVATLDARGADTSKAKALCFKNFMTYEDGNRCLDELQTEAQSLGGYVIMQ